VVIPLLPEPAGIKPHGGASGHASFFADGLAAFRRIRETLAEAVARGPRVWTPNGRWNTRVCASPNCPLR